MSVSSIVVRVVAVQVKGPARGHVKRMDTEASIDHQVTQTHTTQSGYVRREVTMHSEHSKEDHVYNVLTTLDE